MLLTFSWPMSMRQRLGLKKPPLLQVDAVNLTLSRRCLYLIQQPPYPGLLVSLPRFELWSSLFSTISSSNNSILSTVSIPSLGYLQYWYLISQSRGALNHQLQVACIRGSRTLCTPLPANMHRTCRSKLLSLTIFLQSVSCCKSTAVTPDGGGALRSDTVGLRTGH